MPQLLFSFAKLCNLLRNAKKNRKKCKKKRFLQYTATFYMIPDECPGDNIKKMKISHWKELAFNYF